jgi:hypothetical protein
VRITIYLIISFLLTACQNNSAIIDGYTNKTSYIPGDTVKFSINAKKTGTHYLKIYDLNGKVVHQIEAQIQSQTINTSKPYEEGYGYLQSFEWVLPPLKSGIYSLEKKISFIVMNKETIADFTFVYPINTICAYEESGGKSFYDFNSSENKRANKLSFLRPIRFTTYSISESFLKFLFNQTEFTIQFISDRELDKPILWQNSKALIIGGHSEYWTRESRKNFDEFVNNGKPAAIFSGNTMWWQVRYESDDNTLVCYKEAKLDPIQDSLLLSVNWFEPYLQYSIYQSIGADFNFGGYGDSKEYSGFRGMKILNNHPILQNTSFKVGNMIPFITHEYDGIPYSYINNEGLPVLDTSLWNPHYFELIAYDKAYRNGNRTGSFFVFRNSEKSGLVVNFASTNALSTAFDNNPKAMRKLLINTMKYLLEQN